MIRIPRRLFRLLSATALAAAVVAGSVAPVRSETTPGCALGEVLARERPALAARLKGDKAFHTDANRAAFDPWAKAVDRLLKESGDAAALTTWGRFRSLAPNDRAADPALPEIVAAYAMQRYGPDLEAGLAALNRCRAVAGVTDSAGSSARVLAVMDSIAGAQGVTSTASSDAPEVVLEFGTGGAEVTFWGHLDVPPAGADWTGDPWHCSFSDSAWVGRGVAEGAGPALAALFALRASRDVIGNLPMPAHLRLRLDALSTPTPITFSGGPALFLGGSATRAGLSRRARLTFRISTNFKRMDLRPEACSWRTDAIRTESPGDWVPASVELMITPVGRTVNSAMSQLDNRITKYNGEHSRARIGLRRDEGRVYVTATGRLAPAQLPELGDNPCIDLAMFLQSLGYVCPSPAALTTLFLAENVAYERSGRGLGLSRKNEAGLGTALTVTDLGASGDSAWSEFELYHPGVQTEEEMLGEVRERLKIFNDRYGAGLRVTIAARTPAVEASDPAAAERLERLTAGCATPAPPAESVAWPGRWDLKDALPLGTLSPLDRPNNMVDERTTPALVTTYMARVVRAVVR